MNSLGSNELVEHPLAQSQISAVEGICSSGIIHGNMISLIIPSSRIDLHGIIFNPLGKRSPPGWLHGGDRYCLVDLALRPAMFSFCFGLNLEMPMPLRSPKPS
ncbi:hypothetical protein RHECNPAF_930089 [Rhizobium etli CNPAF512]|nr:hypothetical protein RHECNPAF_930089 [Rhizobium etli CNPAF512]